MDKELFDQLHQSMKEAVAIAKGEIQPSRVFTIQPPDVKTVREKTGLSQAMFAAMIGVKVKTLQNWEQHRRNPTGAAAALLTIFDREPETAMKAFAWLGLKLLYGGDWGDQDNRVSKRPDRGAERSVGSCGIYECGH